MDKRKGATQLRLEFPSRAAQILEVLAAQRNRLRVGRPGDGSLECPVDMHAGTVRVGGRGERRVHRTADNAIAQHEHAAGVRSRQRAEQVAGRGDGIRAVEHRRAEVAVPVLPGLDSADWQPIPVSTPPHR